MSLTDLKHAALAYANAGLSVLPLTPRDKTPLLDDWPHKATTDGPTISKWWTRWPNANIGLHVEKSGLAVLDVDPRNGGADSLRELKRERGEGWISHLKVNTGGGGFHFIYTHSGKASFPAQLARGIDLKTGTSYIVAPPSVHPSGKVYAFDGCTLLNGELDFVPPVPPWFANGRGELSNVDTDDWTALYVQVDPETPENVDRVKVALEHISADCSRDEWRNMLFAITSTGWDCADEVAREWSMSAPALFEEGAFLNVVNSAKADRPNGITLGTLFAKATANGWKDPRKERRTFESYGDLSNGRRLADRFRGRLLYVHAVATWYAWNGQRWAPCDSGEAMPAAKLIADECISETVSALRNDPTEGAKRNVTQALGVHRSIRRLEAMLQVAASEPGMSIAHPGLLDADPLKIGVQNGVLDLRNGELLEARPDMLISRQTGTPYVWQAECPTWDQFLSDAMQGDAEMVAFLRRICGYALTGLVDDEKLFFMYGTGANGKSVFANVVSAVMGEYAVTVRAALLARDPKGSGSDAEREKARLPGARIALVNETGQADVWDDQRVKESVSRERISARQLYGESFDFMPTHKLFVRGNHQPGAMDGSEGFWRRIVMIGFTRQFSEAERIPDLDRKIVDRELPGVLSWMVAGCLEWQKYGLQVPPSIAAAVATYRRDTDLMGEWIDACCTVCPGAEGSINDLFRSYEFFLKEANTRAPSRNTFGRQLVQRGFAKRSSNGRTLYSGVAIRNPFEGDDL